MNYLKIHNISIIRKFTCLAESKMMEKKVREAYKQEHIAKIDFKASSALLVRF